MTPNAYATSLRQLRELEKAKNLDFTEQAVACLTMRLNAIDASGLPPERQQRERDRAIKQYDVFMQRPVPANG